MTIENKKLGELNFGSEDAETEMILDDGKYFTKVYLDCFEIQNQIENGKFIVHGRKGTGKSAFACHIERSVAANLFCSKLAFKMNEIEEMVQSPEVELSGAKIEALWRWIGLCHIGKFILSDNSILLPVQTRKDLETFYSKNQGYCEPHALKLKEKIETDRMEVAVAALNRLLEVNGFKEMVVKGTKASFIEILNPLSEVLKKIFRETQRDKKNKFFLIVDDLDHGYMGTPQQKDAVLGILRAFKALMIEFNTIGAKFYPVVLIRTDMISDLNREPDVNKLRIANGIGLVWYDHDQFKQDEREVFLRKLVSERVRYSYGKKANEGDNWSVIFEEESFGPKGSFKYLLDRTLYRPRDLISFLNIIKKSYPREPLINKKMVDSCFKQFSDYMMNEWRGELAAHLSGEAADELVNAVRSIKGEFSFADWESFPFTRLQADYALEIAYEFGLIGQKVDINGGERMTWSHRPSEDDRFDFSTSNRFIIHFAAIPRDRSFIRWN